MNWREKYPKQQVCDTIMDLVAERLEAYHYSLSIQIDELMDKRAELNRAWGEWDLDWIQSNGFITREDREFVEAHDGEAERDVTGSEYYVDEYMLGWSEDPWDLDRFCDCLQRVVGKYAKVVPVQGWASNDDVDLVSEEAFDAAKRLYFEEASK